MSNELNNKQNINEHQLNAFVDNELDAQERELIFAEAGESNTIDQELCEYRKLKDLVQHAYSDVPAPYSGSNDHRKKRKAGIRKYLSAAALMFVGSFFGALLSHNFGPGNAQTPQFAQTGNSNPTGIVQDINRVVLHLDSNDVDLMDAALSRAEELVSSSAKKSPILIEVIANDKGLDLLRSDTSPYADRISNLSKQNVAFMACARGVQNLRNANVKANLLPETNFHYTALDRVVDRLKHGWSYEKI